MLTQRFGGAGFRVFIKHGNVNKTNFYENISATSNNKAEKVFSKFRNLEHSKSVENVRRGGRRRHVMK